MRARKARPMNYRIYGPYEIPREGGEFKKRIDKEDIDEFWSNVDSDLKDACGCYVFSIKTEKKEKPWYVGKARNQSFYQECFTSHKIVRYHEALAKSNGTPIMYFLARFTEGGSRRSKPSTSKTGHAEMDFVERMFIELGYVRNNDIRNKQGTKNPEKLVIEGFYNHTDFRKNTVKKLRHVFGFTKE